jgi:hypothetical protein
MAGKGPMKSKFDFGFADDEDDVLPGDINVSVPSRTAATTRAA